MGIGRRAVTFKEGREEKLTSPLQQAYQDQHQGIVEDHFHPSFQLLGHSTKLNLLRILHRHKSDNHYHNIHQVQALLVSGESFVEDEVVAILLPKR